MLAAKGVADRSVLICDLLLGRTKDPQHHLAHHVGVDVHLTDDRSSPNAPGGATPAHPAEREPCDSGLGASLWKAAGTGDIGHEPPQMWADSLDESIGSIEHPCCVGYPECLAESSGRLECFEKRDEGRTTNEILMSDSDEVPVVGALVGSQSREQLVNHRVVKRDEGKAVLDVKFGDKTCRGSAKPSAAGVDEGRPAKVGHDHPLLLSASVVAGSGDVPRSNTAAYHRPPRPLRNLWNPAASRCCSMLFTSCT